MNKFTDYKIANSEEDFQKILYLRKRIWTKYYNEPIANIDVVVDDFHTHIMAIKNSRIVGAIEIFGPLKNQSISDEFDLDISKYRTDNDFELRKLAVLEYEKNTLLAGTLMGMGYEYIKRKKGKRIFIKVPVKDNVLKKIYQKFVFVFVDVGHFNHRDLLTLVIMFLDIREGESSSRCLGIRRLAKLKYDEFLKSTEL